MNDLNNTNDIKKQSRKLWKNFNDILIAAKKRLM